MGSGKPLPYLNGWLVFTATFALLYLSARFALSWTIPSCPAVPCPGSQVPPPFYIAIGLNIGYAATTLASLFPAPLNGFLSTGIAVIALPVTALVKFLDAAKLGSGQRFRSLESKLSRKGVRNPAAVAAAIGRAKYGKAKFQSLSQRARRRRQ